MKDTKMKKQSVATWTKSNSEIADFYENTKLIVYKGCSIASWNGATLRRADWDSVRNAVAIKYGNGKLEYNSSKGAKYSTFLCRVAKNCAIDHIRRLHPGLFTDLDGKGWN